MFQSLKERVKGFLFGDDNKKKYEFVQELFLYNACWKDYPTVKGGLTGLTVSDISKYLEEYNYKHTIVEIQDIIKELVARQQIMKAGYDKDQNPIYRALRWD